MNEHSQELRSLKNLDLTI